MEKEHGECTTGNSMGQNCKVTADGQEVGEEFDDFGANPMDSSVPQDIELKRDPDVETLESILDASAHVPVSALRIIPSPKQTSSSSAPSVLTLLLTLPATTNRQKKSSVSTVTASKLAVERNPACHNDTSSPSNLISAPETRNGASRFN